MDVDDVIYHGQEDFGQGGGSNPMMQLLAYYSKIVSKEYTSAACQQTCFPSLGLELFGNVFRIHAFYLAKNKICSEPLTPFLHLSDMRLSVPGYTEQLARTLKALVLTLDKLYDFYQPYRMANAHFPSAGFVASEFPYAVKER